MEVFDRGFWVNTENYGSHCLETLMNLHEYRISINIHECPCWLKLKMYLQQLQHVTFSWKVSRLVDPALQRHPARRCGCASFVQGTDDFCHFFPKNSKLWGSCEAVSLKNASEKNMMPLWDLWDVWSAGISVVKTIVCYVTATLSDVAYGRASHLGSRIEKMQWSEV